MKEEPMYPKFQFASPEQTPQVDFAGRPLEVGELVRFVRPAHSESLLYSEDERVLPTLDYRVLETRVVPGNEAWLAQVNYDVVTPPPEHYHWFMAVVYVAAARRDKHGKVMPLPGDCGDASITRQSRYRRWLPSVCVRCIGSPVPSPVLGVDYSASAFETNTLCRDAMTVREGVWSSLPTAQLVRFVLDNPGIRNELMASLGTRRKVTPERVKHLAEGEWRHKGLQLSRRVPWTVQHELFELPVDYAAVAAFLQRLASFGHLCVPACESLPGYDVGAKAQRFLREFGC